eukprot:398743_1
MSNHSMYGNGTISTNIFVCKKFAFYGIFNAIRYILMTLLIAYSPIINGCPNPNHDVCNCSVYAMAVTCIYSILLVCGAKLELKKYKSPKIANDREKIQMLQKISEKALQATGFYNVPISAICLYLNYEEIFDGTNVCLDTRELWMVFGIAAYVGIPVFFIFIVVMCCYVCGCCNYLCPVQEKDPSITDVQALSDLVETLDNHPQSALLSGSSQKKMTKTYCVWVLIAILAMGYVLLCFGVLIYVVVDICR